MLRKKHFILYKIIRLPAIAVDVDSCRCYRLKALTKSCECLAFVPPVANATGRNRICGVRTQKTQPTTSWLHLALASAERALMCRFGWVFSHFSIHGPVIVVSKS